jgi:hypothetical protein
MRSSWSRVEETATVLQLDQVLSENAALFQQVAPESDPDLAADEGGALWMGVGFQQEAPPQLWVYINARWGPAAPRWSRLRRFAERFGAETAWSNAERLVAGELEPLGMALTCSSRGTSGRVYLSAFGRRLDWYEELARAVHSATFAGALNRFGAILLGEECCYPMASTVCSFGLQEGSRCDLKVEWCGHCHFPNDFEAARRLAGWARSCGVSATSYLDMLDLLSGGRPDRTAPVHHTFAGLGTKGDEIRCTVYLKPQLETNGPG